MTMNEPFFPQRPEVQPKIYAYEDSHPEYKGLLKIGYTTRDVRGRISEQYPTKAPVDDRWSIVLEEVAMRHDGSTFTDRDIHAYLRRKKFKNPNKSEWFECTVKDVKAAILAVKNRSANEEERTLDFKMRPEQSNAIEKTAHYFIHAKKEIPDKTPHFLWNAKMRFGKTFATYQLAKKMGWKKILILTFKPAVESAWEDDLKSHIDFTGWQFISRKEPSLSKVDRNLPLVCFGSFQDYLGKNEVGGIKAKNEWVHTINWDCVVLDEYHFGAWRDSAKELFEAETDEYSEEIEFVEEDMPITTNAYLYLTGTPFRAISNGEFIEEQIYHWTYTDEQQAKTSWEGPNNPYVSLPRMVLLTYRMPDAIRNISAKGEFDEFSLNEFFSATGKNDTASFKHESEVQKWLNMIRGSFTDLTIDNLKLGSQKPPMPYSDVRLLNLLSHTLWFLPSVSACFAMRNLLKQKQNLFYQDYHIIVAAGNKAGMGAEALAPVEEAMNDPLNSKTITLSCGKLMTGISVKPWTGIFMLKNIKSPETYFQAAFRVQTPWTIKNPDKKNPTQEEILKKECYVFDFAPDRALKQIADYSCSLSIGNENPETKVKEFIQFLPVLAFDGYSMKQIDPAGVLDMAMSGTTATLLARRWESNLLVNVDNYTLERLINNEVAVKALMKIEGFRTLNKDIETIINKSDSIHKLKLKANKSELGQDEKRILSDHEKECKGIRKQIQEKLIKFAIRIPVFMYLTDYREQTLYDVITEIESDLFKKVTGLKKKDFKLLVNLEVFNSGRINDAVYKFKRYEDTSLGYTGINKHVGEKTGLFDTIHTENPLTFSNEDL